MGVARGPEFNRSTWEICPMCELEFRKRKPEKMYCDRCIAKIRNKKKREAIWLTLKEE